MPTPQEQTATGTPPPVDRKSGSPAHPAADQNPWPGLDFYTEKTARFFHGRTDEAEELLSRLRRRRITVLYGQSGLGKSSVLQAGLFPLARRDGWLPIYIRLRYSAIGSTDTGLLEPLISQALKEISGTIRRELKEGNLRLPPAADGDPEAPATKAALEAVLPRSGETLWDYLHRPGVTLIDSQGRGVALVLAFDQFEEIFTLGRNVSRAMGRNEFMRDLARCAEEEPPPHPTWNPGDASVESSLWGDHRLIMSLREDFLAQLNDLGWQMPTLLENQMHLRPLTGWQALDAVSKPSQGLVEPLVAREIVESVAAKRRDDPEENGASIGAEAAPAVSAEQTEYAEMRVDPAILSMACRELNEARKSAGEPRIASQLVARLLHDDEQSIFRHFYEDSFALLVEGEAPVMRKEDVPPLKWFIEEKLLQGRRRDVMNYERAKAELVAKGIEDPEAVFRRLIDHRLLRKAPGRGGTALVLELTHDVLCDAICSSREERMQREAEEKRLRELKEASEREEQERKKRQELEAKIQQLNTKRKLVRAVAALSVLSILALGATALVLSEFIAIGRDANTQATAYLKKARALAENPDSGQNAHKALRYATMASVIDANNEEAARIASQLLLERPWCIPVSPPLKTGPSDSFFAAAFPPGGTAIAAVTGAGRLLLWDVQNWAPVETGLLSNDALPGVNSRNALTSAVFSADGRHLMCAWTAPAGDRPAGGAAPPATKAAIWRWENGGYVRSGIDLPLEAGPRSASWSADGKTLLVVISKLGENFCRVFDLSDGQGRLLAGPLSSPETKISAADLSRDGSRVVTATSSGVIQIWTIPSLEPEKKNGEPVILAPPGPVNTASRVFALALSPDNGHLAVTGMNPPMRMWKLGEEPVQIGVEFAGGTAVARAAFDPVSRDAPMFAAGMGKMAAMWKLVGAKAERVGEPLQVAEVFTTPIYSADGTRLITVSGSNWSQGETIRVWQAEPLPPGPSGAALTGKSRPDWLVKLSEAITGCRVTLDFDAPPPETLDRIRAEYESKAGSVTSEYRPLWDRFFRPAK